jgi:hypothetical protein
MLPTAPLPCCCRYSVLPCALEHDVVIAVGTTSTAGSPVRAQNTNPKYGPGSFPSDPAAPVDRSGALQARAAACWATMGMLACLAPFLDRPSFPHLLPLPHLPCSAALFVLQLSSSLRFFSPSTSLLQRRSSLRQLPLFSLDVFVFPSDIPRPHTPSPPSQPPLLSSAVVAVRPVRLQGRVRPRPRRQEAAQCGHPAGGGRQSAGSRWRVLLLRPRRCLHPGRGGRQRHQRTLGALSLSLCVSIPPPCCR